MRTLLFALLVSTALVAYGWDKYDHEIFDLVSELEATEGSGTTFYSFLDVPPSATVSEISKAYRRKSVFMHPDKNPGVKDIHKKFSRLGKISTILRNDETRKKYDFFFKNGVPKWRGTGYYYSRFRPGLGSVLIFLIVLSSILQYLVQSITYKNDLARIEKFVSKARLAAWGPKLNMIEGKRKVKVKVSGGETYIGDDGEEYSSGGKWLEMVVEGEEVFILEPDGQLLLLNQSAALPPTIRRTWFLALIKSIYDPWFSSSALSHMTIEDRDADSESDETDEASDRPSGSLTGTKENGNALQGRMGVNKAGGRRRKMVKRR